MTQTIKMHEDMTLSEVQQMFETAATLEGFHTRFHVCAFLDRYIRSAEHPRVHYVGIERDHIELTEIEDEWDTVEANDIAYAELSFGYALDPADGTRIEPGRPTLVRHGLRTSDVVDAFGIVTDPANRDVVPNVFGIVFVDHNLLVPFTATSSIVLMDFDGGGVDNIAVVDECCLDQSAELSAAVVSRETFIAHPQGQQIVDSSMNDAELEALARAEEQEGIEPELPHRWIYGGVSGPVQPEQIMEPSAQSSTPSESAQETTPPEYRTDPFGPSAIYLFDDIRPKRGNTTLKQNCSYFSRMLRGVKPSANELSEHHHDSIVPEYFRCTTGALQPYADTRRDGGEFIVDFADDYPAVARGFDLLGHYDWLELENRFQESPINREPSDLNGVCVFGLVPLAALIQQLPYDHSIRERAAKHMVRFTYDFCRFNIPQRYIIARNYWIANQIDYWSDLPSTAKPYQRKLRNDVVEAYIELDTLLEQGWKQHLENPRFEMLGPVHSYLAIALEAVTHTDPIRLDANAVRVLAACNLLVLLKAMDVQWTLTQPHNTVMPESLRSLRHNAKWCIDTLRDPQRNRTVEFTADEYFGRYFGSLLPFLFAKDWKPNNNTFSCVDDYDWNTPPRVIRTLCELVSAANSEDGRPDPNDFFCAAGSEPQFIVRNLKKRYGLDDVDQMTGLMGRPLIPGIGKRMSWIPERLM